MRLLWPGPKRRTSRWHRAPLVKLCDFEVDAVGQVSAGAYALVDRLQVVRPYARRQLAEKGVCVTFDVADALDEAAARAKLQRAVSLQQSMLTRLRRRHPAVRGCKTNG